MLSLLSKTAIFEAVDFCIVLTRIRSRTEQAYEIPHGYKFDK